MKNTKVWVVYEDYFSDRFVIGVASSREMVDKIIEEYTRYYGGDVGLFWWEEFELDKVPIVD
jgi:hypothetical protein